MRTMTTKACDGVDALQRRSVDSVTASSVSIMIARKGWRWRLFGTKVTRVTIRAQSHSEVHPGATGDADG